MIPAQLSVTDQESLQADICACGTSVAEGPSRNRAALRPCHLSCRDICLSPSLTEGSTPLLAAMLHSVPHPSADASFRNTNDQQDRTTYTHVTARHALPAAGKSVRESSKFRGTKCLKVFTPGYRLSNGHIEPSQRSSVANSGEMHWFAVPCPARAFKTVVFVALYCVYPR